MCLGSTRQYCSADFYSFNKVGEGKHLRLTSKGAGWAASCVKCNYSRVSVWDMLSPASSLCMSQYYSKGIQEAISHYNSHCAKSFTETTEDNISFFLGTQPFASKSNTLNVTSYLKQGRLCLDRLLCSLVSFDSTLNSTFSSIRPSLNPHPVPIKRFTLIWRAETSPKCLQGKDFFFKTHSGLQFDLLLASKIWALTRLHN